MDVKIGDRVMVYGHVFVLTEFRLEQGYPPQAVFMSPAELLEVEKERIDSVEGTKTFDSTSIGTSEV
jgi:hypothetical protein